jgi:hypothetical protein
VAKDRARPFSRKHRKYWVTVTGGMLFICGLNIAIGMCAYEPPHEVEPITPVLPAAPKPPEGTIGLGEIPTPVMRAFAIAYPRHIPAPKKLTAGGETIYELSFTDGGVVKRVTYKPDGTFVRAE